MGAVLSVITALVNVRLCGAVSHERTGRKPSIATHQSISPSFETD